MMHIWSWKRSACALAGALALSGPVAVLALAPAPAGAISPVLTVDTNNISFQATTLGDYSGGIPFTLTNHGAAQIVINGGITGPSGFVITGVGADDYTGIPASTCNVDPNGNVTIAASQSCTFDNFFNPGALGPRPASLQITDEAADPSVTVNFSGSGSIGYYQVSASGQVAHFGDAAFYGDASNLNLKKPIVGIAQTGDNGGYWLVATDGGIFNYGDAPFLGSAGALPLNKPIVGMASIGAPGQDPGYWLVASDGGIFSYGAAQFYGSTGNLNLNKPIVGMAPTPDGGGYWLVASDGGIFAYGDAQFYGSTGAIHLAQPIVGMTAMPDGVGYWFTAADGGLFNYGDAPFYGAANSQGIGNVVAMTTDGAPTLQAFLDIPAIRAHGWVQQPSWGAAPHGPHFAGP